MWLVSGFNSPEGGMKALLFQQSRQQVGAERGEAVGSEEH